MSCLLLKSEGHKILSLKQLVFIIGLLPVIFISCQRKSGLFSSTGGRQEKVIEDIHKRKFHWMVTKNVDSLALLLHEDVTYIHSNGWLENKGEVLENIRTEKLRYHNVNIQESKCVISGKTAVVTGKALFSVSLDEKPIEISLLYTEVYSLEKKVVKLVARHACRL